jgi:hypothetical protein
MDRTPLEDLSKDGSILLEWILRRIRWTHFKWLWILPSCRLLWTRLSAVRCEVFTAVTMKNVVFWDIKTQFVLHRRHIMSPLQRPASLCYVRFEVLTAVTMKNGVFWDVTSCGSCKNRRFEGT